MEKWFVAPSYKNAEILRVNEETHKAEIKERCDRCGGRGIIAARVENEHIVPIPVDGGICYKCWGEGKIVKWVKAYTEKEYNQYLKAQERAKERKAEKAEIERQEKLNKSEENRIAKLIEWGYDPENPLVWIVTGDNTYSIKDQLKENGCRFNPTFGWYSTQPVDVPVGYGQISINFNDVYDWFPMSQNFMLKDNAKEIADAAISAAMPKSNSEWIGEIKDRIRDLEVVLTNARQIDGFYGTTTIFTFVHGEDVIVWMTTSCKYDVEIGDHILLTGTVKEHSEYKGVKQTKMSRCILKREEV